MEWGNENVDMGMGTYSCTSCSVGSQVELKMRKEDGLQWASLEASATSKQPQPRQLPLASETGWLHIHD